MTESIWIRLNTNKNKKTIKPGRPGGSTIDPDKPINQQKNKTLSISSLTLIMY
jgi:hypothetical protein